MRLLGKFIAVCLASALLPGSLARAQLSSAQLGWVSICDDPYYRNDPYYPKYCSGRGSSGGTVDDEDARRRRRVQIELYRQLQELARKEAERKKKASDADNAGLNAADRGEWHAAVTHFTEALRLDPGNLAYQQHLEHANRKLADAANAEQLAAMRREVQDKIAAYRLQARRQHMQDRANAERIALMIADTEAKRSGRGTFKYAGNGLIGGTSWLMFASRQPGESEERMREVIKRQSQLAGAAYDASVDLKRYQFVLGMASSINVFADLKNRVVFDELTNGQFSAREQGLYDKMRGKRFDELGCHSNGAMLCLAALKNGDAKAENVILYGPQVTRESLAMWNQLVADKVVKSVKVYINDNDPVPGASIAFMDVTDGLARAGTPGGKAPASNGTSTGSLFHLDGLKQTINEVSPRLLVQTFPCERSRTSAECHAMSMYQAKVNCTGKSSGKLVPGTGIHGRKSDLPEPPLPCEAIGGR